jgi:CubicO group peptidase (beta-lactamase class C family)
MVASIAVAALSDAALDRARAYAARHDGLSLLILHDGGVVLEDYPEGGPDDAHALHSGTKSFLGVLAAAAVQDGLLTLDERVSETLTEWRNEPLKAGATLRQLLNLTVGLPSQIGVIPTYADAIAMPFNANPGERFQYGPAPFQVFGEILRRKLGDAGRTADPLTYLHDRVLDPIGLRYADWARGADGLPRLPAGAAMSARAWARFGEFVRVGGVVDGARLVDEQAFAAMFQGSRANPAYGMTWWLPRPTPAVDPVTRLNDASRHADALPADLVMANGAGHQMLYVVPSLKLTIVRQARLDIVKVMREASPEGPGPDDWSDFAFLSTLLGPHETR